MNLAEFHFLRPFWLWLLLPLAILIWRLLRANGSANAWRELVDPHLLPRLLVEAGGGLRRLPIVLLSIGWLALVLALAGPTWERLPQPTYRAEQFRILALDISASMNATDLSPSRLAQARFKVMDLLRQTTDGQTALLAYGAEPYVVSPLTGDTDTIAAQVSELSTDLQPVQGAKRTDLALEQAGDLLTQAGAQYGEIILITDGLENPATAIAMANKLHGWGFKVSVLAMSTPNGAPVPLAEGGFLKDQQGAILMPKLDADTLRNLARAGGGRYVQATPGVQDVEALMPVAGATMTQDAQRQETLAEQWQEAGPWLLLVLLPLAALGFRRGWLSPLILFLVILPPTPDAYALSWDDLWSRPDQQAMRKLENGAAAEAAAQFQHPDWQAAAHYQAGEYDQVLQNLTDRSGPDTAYNQGNTLAKLGKLQEALGAYDRALKFRPEDEDARFNRDLVQKLLEQQKDPEQQKQGQQGEQQQSDSQDGQQGQKGQNQKQDQQGQQSQQQQGEQQNKQGQQGQNDQQGSQERQDQSKQSQESQTGDQQNQAQQQDKQNETTDRDAKSKEQKQQEQAAQELAKQGEQDQTAQADASKPEQSDADKQQPGLADLLGGKSQPGAAADNPKETRNPEDLQAMEQMLRRVEDDPAGLLRQRFLLQHLRRSGQLP